MSVRLKGLDDPSDVVIACGCHIYFGGHMTQAPALMSDGSLEVEHIPEVRYGVIFQPCSDHAPCTCRKNSKPIN